MCLLRIRIDPIFHIDIQHRSKIWRFELMGEVMHFDGVFFINICQIDFILKVLLVKLKKWIGGEDSDAFLLSEVVSRG